VVAVSLKKIGATIAGIAALLDAIENSPVKLALEPHYR
jgi:hypothetical protein